VTILLGSLVALGVVLPHSLPLERAAPALAATTWCAALALRALSVLYVVLYLALFLPHTELFSALTHWCWETIFPLIATHLGLDGTHVGGGAVVLPAAVLAVSVTSAAWGLLRAARAVRGALRRAVVGTGPRESVIVAGPNVLLAAAGVTRPRVLVSAGALITLDDEELAAGLDHERGHIARRHRFVLLFAELCRALAGFLPGTHHAVQELRFHLERDADRWALARRHDPYALAGAICKAAPLQQPPNPRMASLGGGDATRRVDELLASERSRCGRPLGWCLSASAAVLSCLALSLGATLPATAATGVQQIGKPAHRHCEH
jgi:Zn-dependent protease with chaperone function